MDFLWIIIVVFIVLIAYFLVVYNILIKLKNNVDEAFATMDVYLKKRYELIPNLVETVKGYAKHEKETLDNVIKARSVSYDNMNDNEKMKCNELLSDNIKKIFIISEAYPDLKADQSFIELSRQLTNIENDIVNARKYYNAVVKKYNNRVQIIPSNIIAKATGFHALKMFEAKENERESVKVKL